MRAHLAVVALGSNVGDRETALRAAVAEFSLFSEQLGLSSFYETVYEGKNGPQDAYLNAAALISTDLTALQLFEALLAIETRFGRTDKGTEAPRVLDLDLIFFDKMMADFGSLILPHPRMHLRRFVLDPVCDVAPDWEHPILRKSVRELASR